MRAPQRLIVIAGLVLAALFLIAVIRSILQRAETTYNYPDYSSLNNSNDGAKAYFETLRQLGFTVSRNYRPLHKLLGTHADILSLGQTLSYFRYSDVDSLEEIEHLAQAGARYVITFEPDGVIQHKKPNPADKEDKHRTPPEDNLQKRWAIELTATDRQVSAFEQGIMKQLNQAAVTWHFAKWNEQWTPSHVRAGYPLILERRFGKGSIVLIAETREFTNKELLLHPDTDLLSAAVSAGPRDIIFDEAHLGLEDTGTVVGLAAAHRLEWMLLGFIVLAALYIWHSAISFVPPSAARPQTSVSGRDAYSALSNLLQQSIPKKSILQRITEEWNRLAVKSHRRMHPFSTEEINRLALVDPAHATAEYRTLAESARRSSSK